jgi:hypothetical protein
MGIFDNVFSPENVEAREKINRKRTEENARKERERTENAGPALKYFLELVAEEMGEFFARGADHYPLSYAGRLPISRKVQERYGDGVFAIEHEDVARILDAEGYTCVRSPHPSGGYHVRPKPRQ